MKSEPPAGSKKKEKKELSSCPTQVRELRE